MGRGINDRLVVRSDKGAGRDALSGRDLAHMGAVVMHAEDRVAAEVAARGLKDELAAIVRKIGLRILAAKRQLCDVLEMWLVVDRCGVNGVQPDEQRRNYQPYEVVHERCLP